LSNGKRLNTSLSREIKLIDGEKEVNISVYYKQDGSYELKLPEKQTPVKVSGTLIDGEMRAFVDDRKFDATVIFDNMNMHLFFEGKDYTIRIPVKDYSGSTAAKGSLLSPMPGKIVKVLVQLNQKVQKGTPLMIMEAMKMEHTIRAPMNGTVEKINYNLNDLVEEKKQLLSIHEDK